MYLRDLPAIFAWEEPSETLTVLHARYVALLATRLGALMGRVTARGTGPEAADVGTLVDMAPAETLTAVLSAPEVSFRLLWPAHHDDTDALGFIGETLRGVVDRPPASRLSHPLLVATDPDVLGLDGSVVARWPLARELPLDVASPFALSADVVGTLIRLPEPGPCLSATDVRATVLKLGGAVAKIADGVPPAWDVVRDFTKVVMLLPDRNAPSQFSSGSSGQFVGRTVLSNPHLPAVTQVHLAEALVHEAIHSVLYMDEQHDPWVLDPALYAGPMRIASPWTRNPLPLRPFLQACFVWYGLVTFWSSALGRCRFDRTAVRDRLDLAASGFFRDDLLDRVRAVEDRLSPELLEAVTSLQETVVAGLGAGAASAAAAY